MESATGVFVEVSKLRKSSLSSPAPGNKLPITGGCFKDHSDPVDPTCIVRVYRVLNMFVKKTMLIVAPEQPAHRFLAIDSVAVKELGLSCSR